MFRISSIDDVLEDVEAGKWKAGLLGSGDGMEVTRQTYSSGMTIAFEPGFDGLEVVYIVSGQLSSDLGRSGCDAAGVEIVPAGSLIFARDVKERRFFRTVGDVTLLSFTSRPTFHHISKCARELVLMAEQMHLHDGYTEDHCQRSKDLALAIAKRLGLSPESQAFVVSASRLHDIGKSRIPREILQKPGRLTPEEFEIVKSHPTYGREIVGNTYMKEIAVIVGQHHERPDGLGYPEGLTKEQIRIEAAIVSVIDSYDAMTNDRPYRRAMSPEEAVAELRRCAGTQFFPEVVEALVSVLTERGELSDSSLR